MLYPVKIEFKDYPSGSWQDWSEYLSSPPTINKKVESENEGEAGLIVFDEASVSFRYEIGSPVYNAFSIDLSIKQRYLFRISAPKSDKSYVQLFEGMADFSTLIWGEYDKVITFTLLDKLSALNILQNRPVRTLQSIKDSTANHLPWIVPLNYAAGDYYIINVGVNPTVIIEVIKYVAPNFIPQHINVGSSTPVISAGMVLLRQESAGNKILFARAQYFYEGNYPGENDTWIESALNSDLINGSYRIDSSSADAYLVTDPSIKLKYYKDEFYSGEICNTIYYLDPDDGNYKTEVTSFKGEQILKLLIKEAWPDITITFRGFTTFNIPFSYWAQTLDENPFNKTPLDLLKMLANTMKSYVYVDRTGNVIVQSKDYLATSGTARSIGSTKIISGPEKKYFWDKLVDGVTVNVQSWVVEESTGEALVGVSEMTKQPSGFTATARIKPKNEITKEIFAGSDTVDTQAELDSIAAQEALAILNFYGLRHSACDLVLNLDDNTIYWDLIDTMFIGSDQMFFTSLEFDLDERTVTLEPVEIAGHDYDLRSIVVGLADNYNQSSSIVRSGSFSSGGINYVFNAPLVVSGGIVSLPYTNNLKLTSNQLDTIQDIATTSTPTFNQLSLGAASSSAIHAVRADRIISATLPITGGGNLTADRTLVLNYTFPLVLNGSNQLTIGYNLTNLKLTTNQLNTIQDIAVTSTPTFNQLNLSVAASSTVNAVRADRTISATLPITGGGNLTADITLNLNYTYPLILNGSNQLTIGYNSINLKLTSNQLNTIQDIATTSSPQFVNAILTGLTAYYIPYKTTTTFANSPIYTTGTNVAIGTTSLTAKLNISGDAVITNGLTTPALWINQTGTGDILSLNKNTVQVAKLDNLGNFNQYGSLSLQNNYSSGWGGTGWRLDYNVSGTGSYLELDNLRVRGSMHIYELVVNQIRVTNGSEFITSRAVVDYISFGTTGDVRVYFEDPTSIGICPFSNGDTIMLQRFDITAGTLRRIVMIVIEAVTGLYVEANYVDRYGSDEPHKGDTVVRLNNSTLYLTSDDVNAPYLQMKSGVANWSEWSTDQSKIKLRLGNLTGLTDIRFGDLSGYGLYTKNIYLTENANVCGTIAAGDDAGFEPSFYAGRIQKNYFKASQDVDVATAGSPLWIYNSGSSYTSYLASATLPTGINGNAVYLRRSSASGTLYAIIDGNTTRVNSTVDFRSKVWTVSFWIKVSNVAIAGNHTFTLQFPDGTTLGTKVYSLSTTWQRVYFTFNCGTGLVSDFIKLFFSPTYSASYGYNIWGFQLEQASIPTIYQKTSNAASVLTTGYGMWASYGGFGGTIQNPAIALSDSGLVIRKDMTSSAAWVGNDTISLGFNGATWGIIGKSGANNVFQLGSTNNIAGWSFTNIMLSSPSGKLNLRSDTNTLYCAPLTSLVKYVMFGQTYNGVSYTGSYGISAIDNSNNYIFRLDDASCQIAGWNFNYQQIYKHTAGTGFSLNMTNTALITVKGFELYDIASPKLFIGDKSGQSISWNVTANTLLITGKVIGSEFWTAASGNTTVVMGSDLGSGANAIYHRQSASPNNYYGHIANVMETTADTGSYPTDLTFNSSFVINSSKTSANYSTSRMHFSLRYEGLTFAELRSRAPSTTTDQAGLYLKRDSNTTVQKVVGQRITGWAAPTGTALRTTFDTSTVSITSLAQRVKALIDDLTTHGLIGT